jgi:hypothetical protein
LPGLDKTSLDSFDFEFALKRIQNDVRSDFILAPHYNFIFLKSGNELSSMVYENIKSGTYEPELPITMSIPKPRGFSRPGSILQPFDRLVYQTIADNISLKVEENLDRTRAFSHVMIPEDKDGFMFRRAHDSWAELMQKVSGMCDSGGYILKADIANYFERIPQHHLINLLHASGCDSNVVSFLEKILLAFREKNSFGIIQGCFPSDLLGNFYLSDLDAYCELNNVPSARYVDDFFMHFSSIENAFKGLLDLIERLRQNGLNINEFKSGIQEAGDLKKEESELDKIFNEAREEVQNGLIKEDIEDDHTRLMVTSHYGFAIDWELGYDSDTEPEVDADEEDIYFAAVQKLYESIDDFPKQSDKIEKFCLPLLNIMDSDIAIDRSIEGIITKPYMARVYNSYLSSFTHRNKDIVEKVESILDDSRIVSDYQIMYILAALMKSESPQRETVNKSIRFLQDHRFKKETRALAALFAAKFGNPQQKRTVRLAYESEPSPYVRSAILYASKHFSTPEKRTCLSAWGGHNPVNALISNALKNE